MSLRPIAFVLPQFHPIPENDAWWGKGFTEWTNVTKAKPLFKGHYQPHLPTDLGFYDLRLPEARKAQADLAKEYGIQGFCYYHYWFNGKRLLNQPLDGMLKQPDLEMPFMYCWANENWTRRWDGLENEILIKQDYSLEDDKNHMRWLCEHVFSDKRYITVDGKPVFMVYKPFLIPNPEETVKVWREVGSEYDLELYLCHTVFSYKENWSKLIKGFNAVIDFEPFGIRKDNVFKYMNYQRAKKSFYNKLKMFFNLSGDNSYKYNLNVLDYEWMFNNLKSLEDFDLKIYPSIVPGWDNTARRSDSPTLILQNSTPEKFEDWLKNIVDDFKPYSPDENLIFINAMNEWAEGNHLEPCIKWGVKYLEKVKKIVG